MPSRLGHRLYRKNDCLKMFFVVYSITSIIDTGQSKWCVKYGVPIGSFNITENTWKAVLMYYNIDCFLLHCILYWPAIPTCTSLLNCFYTIAVRLTKSAVMQIYWISPLVEQLNEMMEESGCDVVLTVNFCILYRVDLGWDQIILIGMIMCFRK